MKPEPEKVTYEGEEISREVALMCLTILEATRNLGMEQIQLEISNQGCDE